MKTKSLISIIIICLINGLSTYAQTVENEIVINDTINNSNPDSVNSAGNNPSQPIFNDSIIYKPLQKTMADTNAAKPKPKPVLEAKVEYSADDSTIYSVDGKKVFLFGNAKIKYLDIDLTAAYIEVDMEKNILYAEGKVDSAGKEVGQPVFVQGGEEIKSKTITYNVKTQKGFIKGLYTQQDEGYLHSDNTKKEADNSINLNKGKYTTCDLEHPHFYVYITKGKVVPDKAIVAGPSFMVIEDVPLYPIFIPFGFFPNTKNKASGFLIPTFGEENSRGFYLKDGGYYFAMNEYADLAIKGDVYSKGSWQVGATSKYKLKYKFSGNVDLGYSKVIVSEKGLSDYRESNEYRVIWNHSQDAKARPNSNFSASVNFRSAGDNKYNSTTSEDYLTNTTSSSISYRKTFANTPFATSINLRHSQNNKDSTVSLTLPQMTLTMNRIYPFRPKKQVGKVKWYQNIGITYTGNFENKVSVTDSLLFTEKVFDEFNSGVKHSIPLSTSLKVLKYFNLSPSIGYNERWYFKGKYRYMDEDSVVHEVDSSGFKRIYDYSYSLGFGTTVYGMFQFKKGPIKAFRHVITPSVSFSYRPDFAADKYGYYEKDPKTGALYSPYSNSIYGTAPTGESGALSFSLTNNLEMKVKSKKDTVNNELKIKLLESFNLSTGYDMIKDSLNWSPLSISARTTLFKSLGINVSATGNFYAIDSTGKLIDVFESRVTGNPFRITNASASTGFSINSKTLMDGLMGSATNQDPPAVTPGTISNPVYGYDYFEIPWNISINYSLSYSKPAYTPKISQTLGFSGDFSLTKKWKINFRSGWDFIANDFSYTSFGLTRDLHCWVATVSAVPFGPRQSYNFTIGIKSSVLQDLKYNKNQSWLDNYAQ